MSELEKCFIQVLREYGPSEEKFIIEKLKLKVVNEKLNQNEYNSLISSMFRERVIKYSGEKIALAVI